MVEKHALATLVRSSPVIAVVLLATLLLTVFRDLTEGIVAGVVLSVVLPRIVSYASAKLRRRP
jgi:SulP family sulfate permease